MLYQNNQKSKKVPDFAKRYTQTRSKHLIYYFKLINKYNLFLETSVAQLTNLYMKNKIIKKL